MLNYLTSGRWTSHPMWLKDLPGLHTLFWVSLSAPAITTVPPCDPSTHGTSPCKTKEVTEHRMLDWERSHKPRAALCKREKASLPDDVLHSMLQLTLTVNKSCVLLFKRYTGWQCILADIKMIVLFSQTLWPIRKDVISCHSGSSLLPVFLIFLYNFLSFIPLIVWPLGYIFLLHTNRLYFPLICNNLSLLRRYPRLCNAKPPKSSPDALRLWRTKHGPFCP